MSLQVWRHPKPRGAAGLCVGRIDLAVDRRKAKRLAHRIRAHARRQGLARDVVTSGLQRSASVGRALAGWGWRHSVDPRLDEFDFGAWDGKPWAEVSRDAIDAWSQAFATHRPGGGESVAGLLERCRAFMAEERECCVVGHAGWISAARWLQANGEEAPRASTWPAALGYGRHIVLG
ncbi:MAG TPA: histidine phosphatase family protein [Burkholderiaceae bacterium]|nr:histidine phosphatase family protein [Burkholderiaceae bacterium]